MKTLLLLLVVSACTATPIDSRATTYPPEPVKEISSQLSPSPVTSPTGAVKPSIQLVQPSQKLSVSASVTVNLAPKKKATKPKVIIPPKIIKLIYDPEVSFYGPGGFYGNRTACGLILTTRLVGVAHRTLPCGTMVRFVNKVKIKGHLQTYTIDAPVVDRGPYCCGRNWDLTGWACVKLRHCYTGPIWFAVIRKGD